MTHPSPSSQVITPSMRRQVRGGSFSLFLFLLLFLSCTDSNKFRLEGEFLGMRQVDLYIYSTDGGLDHLDTLHVIDGYFEWETPLSEPATFYVVYPNMSEQLILASPGDKISLAGNGSQLKLTRVEGSDDNEELTKFRLTHANDADAELKAALQNYVKENPNTRVGQVLQRQLNTLKAKVAGVDKGVRLPSLTFPDDNVSPFDSTCLPKHPMLLVFWAGWSGGSHEMNASLRSFMRENGYISHHKDSVSIATRYAKCPFSPVSISLDVDNRVYDMYRNMDSIDWNTRCYFRVWDTPQVYTLSIRQLPYAILTDSVGKVVAYGSDWQQDLLPHLPAKK